VTNTTLQKLFGWSRYNPGAQMLLTAAARG
jgi:hypothetical protein